VPEVIEHGITGFIVNSEEEALAAIARLPVLDRRKVRAAFEQRFTATTMARAYLDVYARMLGLQMRKTPLIATTGEEEVDAV
jgi:glycosyltransferase involved in cell wall biosynthesis